MSAPGFNVPPYPQPSMPSYPGSAPNYPPVGSTAYQPTGAPGYPGYPPTQNVPPAPHQMPIQMQPVASGFSNVSTPLIPAGLESLTTVDKLFVKQKIELLEAFTGFETANKYSISNANGQKLLYAVEDSGCCTRLCCDNLRPFDLRIMDSSQRELIHLYRPYRCDSCCFPCCLQTVEITSPGAGLLGSIDQNWSLLYPDFDVKDASGNVVLCITGPCCRFSCGGPIEFDVLSRDRQVKVGKISKTWGGFAREFFTDADTFGVSFPMDLDVKMKAVCLGACFLIDYMFFEKTKGKDQDRVGLF